eukprot:1519128-Rhodomonas_salina.3
MIVGGAVWGQPANPWRLVRDMDTRQTLVSASLFSRALLSLDAHPQPPRHHHHHCRRRRRRRRHHHHHASHHHSDNKNTAAANAPKR